MAKEKEFNITSNNADQTCHEEGRRCYTVEDLMYMLNLSRSRVYELLHENKFKWFRIGRGNYRISKRSFDEWLDEL